MSRAPKSPAERCADTLAAVDSLPAAVAAAKAAAFEHGWTDPRTIAAWADVEVLGATVHRQSRLLAGKSKGG